MTASVCFPDVGLELQAIISSLQPAPYLSSTPPVHRLTEAHGWWLPALAHPPHLQSLGSVDGPQGPEHTQNSQDLYNVNCTGPEKEARQGVSLSCAGKAGNTVVSGCPGRLSPGKLVKM